MLVLLLCLPLLATTLQIRFDPPAPHPQGDKAIWAVRSPSSVEVSAKSSLEVVPANKSLHVNETGGGSWTLYRDRSHSVDEVAKLLLHHDPIAVRDAQLLCKKTYLCVGVGGRFEVGG